MASLKTVSVAVDTTCINTAIPLMLQFPPYVKYISTGERRNNWLKYVARRCCGPGMWADHPIAFTRVLLYNDIPVCSACCGVESAHGPAGFCACNRNLPTICPNIDANTSLVGVLLHEENCHVVHLLRRRQPLRLQRCSRRPRRWLRRTGFSYTLWDA